MLAVLVNRKCLPSKVVVPVEGEITPNNKIFPICRMYYILISIFLLHFAFCRILIMCFCLQECLFCFAWLYQGYMIIRLISVYLIILTFGIISWISDTN